MLSVSFLAMSPAVLQSTGLLHATEPADGSHLFILSGQSNMAGLKPEESFTPVVEKAFGNENVIVFKLAVGGQPIRRWDKGWKVEEGDNPKQIADLYKKLIEGVGQSVIAHGSKNEQGGADYASLASVTFVWMQGERDARERHADIYADSFNRVLAQLSEDLGRDDINFVVGRLSDFSSNSYPDWGKMRKVLVGLAEGNPRGAWVDTDDLNDGKNRKGKPIKNDLHYSAEGYVTFGTRLAEAAIGLIQE